MRVLIDECLPRALARHIPGHECATVQQMQWTGKKNGELLSVANPQFDVLLTIDSGIQHQQNLTGRRIAILLLNAHSNQLEDLLPLISKVIFALDSIQPGQVLRVGNLHG